LVKKGCGIQKAATELHMASVMVEVTKGRCKATA
jgi:hypothetical protein